MADATDGYTVTFYESKRDKWWAVAQFFPTRKAALDYARRSVPEGWPYEVHGPDRSDRVFGVGGGTP
jgi:hypothetical protein